MAQMPSESPLKPVSVSDGWWVGQPRLNQEHRLLPPKMTGAGPYKACEWVWLRCTGQMCLSEHEYSVQSHFLRNLLRHWIGPELVAACIFSRFINCCHPPSRLHVKSLQPLEQRWGEIPRLTAVQQTPQTLGEALSALRTREMRAQHLQAFFIFEQIAWLSMSSIAVKRPK
jgi:hypothetical protein